VTAPPAGACPRCGAAYQPGQQYCLECGLRLPVHGGLLASWSEAWRRRGWYPGDWVWPVLVFLVLATLGTLVAILATRGGGNGTLLATHPPVTTSGVPAPTTETLPSTTAPPPTTTPPPRPSRPRKTIISWPVRAGFTIVLQSIPTTSGRGQANQTARRALTAGLHEVGVLQSSHYPSLQPGYYVVFTGVYDSESEAIDHLAAANAAGFGSAYVKQVTT
jgi:hypothetical protein